jgi:hypothetical protein
MAQVPIPWFTGAPVGGFSPYFAKALRERRNLQAVSQGLYDVGAFLRKERSQGLPPGTTDDDLKAQEQKLELELGSAQQKAVDDTTHEHERATTEGDTKGAKAVTDDPAGYASTKHEEKQGLLPQLGNFMKTGAQRLLFGDPQRGERLSHIRRMEGELAAEKDKEEWAKTIGTQCMKSEDPAACLKAMGGRFGITTLPKMAQKPSAVDDLVRSMQPGGGVKGGTRTENEDLDRATEDVLKDYGGVMPTDPETARHVRVLIGQKAESYRLAREKAKRQAATDQNKELTDYKWAKREAHEIEQANRKAAEKSGVDISTSETVWKDARGQTWHITDQQAQMLNAKYPNFGLNKMTVHQKYHRPAAPPPAGNDQPPNGQGGQPPAASPPQAAKPPAHYDPGPSLGFPNFYVPVQPQ